MQDSIKSAEDRSKNSILSAMYTQNSHTLHYIVQHLPTTFIQSFLIKSQRKPTCRSLFKYYIPNLNPQFTKLHSKNKLITQKTEGETSTVYNTFIYTND